MANPTDNVIPPQPQQDAANDAAQQALSASIPQAPNASGPSAQDILSGAMQGAQTPAAPTPVAPPTPTPAAPQQTFFGKLLQGALAGIAGGISAPFGSSDGGQLGIQNANQVEAKRQADLQNAQSTQDRQNQQQFQNQLASNQDSRAQQDQSQQMQMGKVQLASANLSLMKNAQDLASLPEQAKDKFYAGQAALTQNYQKDKTPEIAVLSDDDHHGSLNAFFQAHPDRTTANTVFTHTDDGKIHVFAPIGLNGDQLNEIARKAGMPATFAKGQAYTPEATIAATKDIFDKAADAAKEHDVQRNENARSAASRAPSGPISPEMVQAAGEGRIAIPRGKEGAALLAAVTAKYPDFDQSKQVAYSKLNTSLSSGDMGKQVNTLNTAIAHLGRMEDNIPDNGNTQFVNDFRNKGLTAMGSDRLSRFNADQEAAVGELSKLYKGGVATQAEVDAFKEKVKASSSPQQLRTTINEFKSLVRGKIGAMENQVNSSKPSNAIQDRSLLTPEAASIMNRSSQQGAPIVQRNKTTGATRISHDGGKTWQAQ